MGICLIKAYIGVAIAVLDIDNPVVNDINARSVAEEFLVCRFCIILLRLKELMVEIHIVFIHLSQLASRYQSVDKQCVELVCSVEVVGLAMIGSIGDVTLRQLPDGPEDGVGTACTQGRMIREMAHKMRCHILHARATTEINAHQRTDNLTVLLPDDTAASLTQS